MGTHSGFDLPDGDVIGQEVKARAYISSTQSISANTETKVDLDTVAWDTGDDFSTADNQFTCPVYGYYLINVFITVTNFTAGDVLELRLREDSDTVRDMRANPNAAGNHTLAFTTIEVASADDTFYLNFKDATNAAELLGGFTASYIEIFLLSS